MSCKENPNCTFYFGSCYKNIYQSVALCEDVQPDQIQLCKKINTQGCFIKQQNLCSALQPEDYLTIKCEEAINAAGCKLVSTPGQTCYYDEQQEECKFKDLKNDFNFKCSDLDKINSYKFCEQTKDQSCKYNVNMNKCQIATGNNYDCSRGLNILACYNLTNKLKQCKFLNYCYGPNDQILQCNSNSSYDCCLEAQKKDVCLFQKKFLCQWQQGCQAYQQKEQIECNKIKDASINVCTSIQGYFCIFDSDTFTCKQIFPQSCDQMQTSDQCKRVLDFPCVWDELYEICIYKDKNNLDQCKDIRNKVGNILACIVKFILFPDLQLLNFISKLSTL